MKRILLVLTLALALGCESKPAGTSTTSADTTVENAATAPAETSAQTTTDEGEQEATHVIQIEGEFGAGVGDAAGLPEGATKAHKALADIEVPADVAGQVNEQRDMIVEQVLLRHGVVPGEGEGLPTIVVSIGKEVKPDESRPMTHHGLLVMVDLKRLDGTHRAASRQVPPATNTGELTANFDHTLDALVKVALEKEE